MQVIHVNQMKQVTRWSIWIRWFRWIKWNRWNSERGEMVNVVNEVNQVKQANQVNQVNQAYQPLFRLNCPSLYREVEWRRRNQKRCVWPWYPSSWLREHFSTPLFLRLSDVIVSLRQIYRMRCRLITWKYTSVFLRCDMYHIWCESLDNFTHIVREERRFPF